MKRKLTRRIVTAFFLAVIAGCGGPADVEQAEKEDPTNPTNIAEQSSGDSSDSSGS